MMVYADKFYYDQPIASANAHFVDDAITSDGTINVNTVILDNIQEDWGVIQYVVQQGDSLGGIARRFGTTTSRLQDINQLGRSPIRPWQKLLIVDDEEWFIYTIPAPINVGIFADKYGLNVQDLMSLNYLQDETEVLMAQQEIFINLDLEWAYQAGLLERPKPKPVVVRKPATPVVQTASRTRTSNANVPAATISQPAPARSSSSSSDIVAQWTFNKNISNGFYRGHCTWYAAIITPEIFPYVSETQQNRPFGGNANQWYDNARNAWFAVGQSPRNGALIVYQNGWRWAYAWHVWRIMQYNAAEWKMLIREMNWKWKFIVTDRRESVDNANIKWYIYPPAG